MLGTTTQSASYISAGDAETIEAYMVKPESNRKIRAKLFGEIRHAHPCINITICCLPIVTNHDVVI